MGISWTLIVLGTLLQGMQCNANDDSTTASKGTTVPTSTTADSTKPTTSSASLESTKLATTLASLESTKLTTTLASSESTKLATTLASLESTKLTTTLASSEPTTLASSEPTKLATTLASSEPTKPATISSSPNSTTQAAPTTTKATSPEPTRPSPTVAKQNTANPSQNVLVTTQTTTVQPKTPNAGTTAYNSPQNLPATVIPTNPNQVTTILNKSAATNSTDGTIQLLSTQTNPSDVTKNPTLPSTAASDSKSTASQSLGTTKAQTTTASIVPGQRSEEYITTSTSTPRKSFNHSFDLSSNTEENIVRQACKTLGQKMTGNCSVTVKIYDKQLIATVIINADQNIPPENYKPLATVSGVTDNTTLLKDDVNKDMIPDTLIAILASCGALVLILCCFAAYCTYHRRSYRKNQQQHLTEELQTVENGYHDNPTLEVMEVQPEMQEKKLTMNREFNDSWIVPIDNLLKEDIIDEEDTHL